jgi:DtxR family Mn-dependent transcriptional regulator
VKIQEADENYLEAIFMISKRREKVRATDICNFFGYSRPTISAVIKKFKENGYIRVDGDNFITLTEKGLKIANAMYERHQVMAEILMALGVDEKTAFEDSCRIEHDISQETYEKIKDYYFRHLKNEEL